MQEEEGALLLQIKQYLLQLPLKNWAITAGGALGQGVVLITFSVLICFFFYRDGPAITGRLQAVMEHLAGHRAKYLIEVTAGTVSRVVNGILGTALAQSVLALIGFWIAGVPGAMLLGLLTFFLSIIPMGPPLVWIPATIWLYFQDETVWAIFLLVYGTGGDQQHRQCRQTLPDQPRRVVTVAAGVHGRAGWPDNVRLYRRVPGAGDPGDRLLTTGGMDEPVGTSGRAGRANQRQHR